MDDEKYFGFSNDDISGSSGFHTSNIAVQNIKEYAKHKKEFGLDSNIKKRGFKATYTKLLMKLLI
jgi:hypothetical protein